MDSLLDQSSLLLQQLVNGITLGGVYALIAVGYTMVYGVIQLINFAHGEIYMLGAFLAYTLVTVLGLPLFAAFVLTMLVCSCFGIILDFVAYRPLRKAPRLAALITAIGMSIFLQNLALMIWGSQIKSYPREVLPGVFSKTAWSIGDVTVSWLQVFILSITVVCMAILHFTIRRTRIGTAMRAVSQDKTSAALMGIGVNRVISFTFAVGSGMGAMAGAFYAKWFKFIHPDMFKFWESILILCLIVFGGMGSIAGTMLGALILIPLSEVLRAVLPQGLFGARYLIYGLVLVLMMRWRPEGLIPFERAQASKALVAKERLKL